MFSVHTSSEKFKNATINSQVDLCLKTTRAVQSHGKRNIIVFEKLRRFSRWIIQVGLNVELKLRFLRPGVDPGRGGRALGWSNLLCLCPLVCFSYQRGSPLHNQGHLREFRRPNAEIRLEEKRSSLYKMKTSIFLIKKEICYKR